VAVAAEKLTALLKTFARTLVTEYPIEDSLDRFCAGIVDVLDADGAGIMLEDAGGDLRFVAASNDVIRRLEQLQIDCGEGPCVAAYESGGPTLIDDLDADTRFSKFSPAARLYGMRAVQSFPLKTDDECVGALNLYSTEPTTFDDDDVEAAGLLADMATTYVINSRTLAESFRLAGQLQRALDSRVVIEQAKGRLAEQLAMSIGDAFELMRRYARNNGRKLHEVAAEVVSGTLKLQPDE